MKKKEFLIIGVGIVALVAIILIAFLIFSNNNIKVITDKSEYEAGQALKVKIENNSRKNVCFSSCYPYFLEKKKEEKWEEYLYSKCLTDNLVEICVNPKEVKAFELTLFSMDGGFHRLAIPACVGCNVSEIFQEDKRFYSNEFIVK